MSQINSNPDRAPLPKPEKRGVKPPKYIKNKIDTKWIKVRKEFLEGKASHQGWYQCEGCGGPVRVPEVDHILTRGSRPDLKYDMSNLRIYCVPCHQRRHSQII